MLANEVHDAPAAVALLEVGECKRGHLRSPQAAAQEHGQYGAVAQPAERRYIGRAQKRLRLSLR